MSFIVIAFKNILHRMLQFFSFSNKTFYLNVFIKSNTGKVVSVDLDPKLDIKDVKNIVAPKLGLHPDEVKIIFAGKELSNDIILSDCDLGQQSVLHAVKVKHKIQLESSIDSITEESGDFVSLKPLCTTLTDLSLSNDDLDLTIPENQKPKAHFYVYCPTCKSRKTGKLRVRCHFCKSGAFTVHSDPQSWDDVLQQKRITGSCENDDELCADLLQNVEPTFAEFYFKCAEHVSLGENDGAVPLYLIMPNLREVPCLACTDVCEIVFVFPCTEGHVACLDCFRQYCSSRLKERQFIHHPQYGYTLQCAAGCENSYIVEIHHFKLLTDEQYIQYQKFATEEFVLQSGGVLCPRPDCGMGILLDEDCITNKITCINGCGYVFCRLCLQGYHIGSCDIDETNEEFRDCEYNVDPARASRARWDEASKLTIKVMTKPCPKCRTPTERNGGCMHMTCMRAGCKFEWCWICQSQWTSDCRGSHWFG